ncbi:hypothetical protein Tco_0320353 [Tanacetum coccineum]
MTRSPVKKLRKPLDEPEREFRRLRKAAMRSPQNESLAIAGKNLFDDEASSSNNTGAKPPTAPKTLHHHSRPNSSGKMAEWLDRIPPTQITTWDQLGHEPIKSAWIRFQDLIKQVPHHGIQKWLLVQIFHDNISQIDRRKLDQFTQFRFSSLTKEEGWNRIEEYVQYQDDLWDESSPSMNVSSISEAMKPTLRGRLKRACKQISFLETPTREVCSSGGDIYNDPYLLRFYQNDDTSPWGNNKRKEKGEDGSECTIRSKFEDELANFMIEKKFHTKGIGDMLVQHRKELREQYSQILSAINKSKTPESEAPTFAITTRSGISTRDTPFPAPPRPATDSFTEGETRNEKPEGAEPSTTQEPAPRSSILYQPSKKSNPPFPSRLKKQKKDDEDEHLLSIFKQIQINLSFLEAMIHMPKGAKVLKDLLSHKEKLEKAASSIKLSEECSAIIQRSLPQKEGDTGRPFLATTRAVIAVHEGKLSLRVGSETITFNIGKSMKSRHSRDDYRYCADHTAKLIQEQWVNTVNHDGK